MAGAGGRAAQAFEHDALFYESDQQFVDALVPWLREGLTRGEAAAVASRQSNLTVLQDALGDLASGVAFFEDVDWYVRPASTVAGWNRVLADAAARGSALTRIIGEVRFGVTEEEWTTWTRFESALNAAFAGSPSWIVCPYDLRTLPERVLEDAWRTHPTVWQAERSRSRGYVDPGTLLAAMPPPVAAVNGSPVIEMSLDVDLAELRRRVREVAAPQMSSDRLEELLLAATEVAANALRHGSGARRFTLWITGDDIVCEVTDEGRRSPDPLVGYLRPRLDATQGMGLWLVAQLVDSLSIQNDRRGTRVRFAFPARARPDVMVPR